MHPHLRERGRARRCSAAATAGGGRSSMLRDHTLWVPRLTKLSRSNAGRPIVLEIDDVSRGARTQVLRCPFLGMDYDRHDERITIMIGDPHGGTSHLSHQVMAPVAVEILEGVYGKTLGVRVATARGQVLLTFLT